MKVAMVFDGLITGGIERVGADYAKIFENLGYDITVINLNPKLTEMESEFPESSHIKYVKFSKRVAPERYAQIVKMAWYGRFLYPIIFMCLTLFNVFYKLFCKIRYRFLNDRYDVVIAFSGHFNDLTFVANNYVNANKKMCWLHGALYGYLLISDGYLNLYKKIKNLVVLVSDAEEEVLSYNRGLNLNINKLYNPTFISRVADKDNVNNLRQMYGNYLLMVSRFSYPHKDHYTVLDALKILNEKYHKSPNLVLVGSGPDEAEVKLYSENVLANVESKVFFLGNRKNVQDYYRSAYMLVHASVAGEGLPTVMIEALANDLPMVVTDSKVGPREIIGNDEYGLLSRVQDSMDMASRINLLIEDNAKYNEFVQKSASKLEEFKPENIEIKLKKILDNLV
ncbi:glycosyltransferase [Latilactobacillus sakei]|uniref:N-acetylgalactosamine-N, N'-diacetylbacillosaminyl-diphospho-undecaprenol 4-alpha-N-acetylgalactosaminyltransferase n=1 Tax=Latilactobacillus sakei TaxID=1599 RepID=A0AAE8J4Q3_LATSK|nr:glycosyltransferase [Latilactobacillus sakei]SPE20441.1 N-acetylgalactosamine-N, N'-diacetylbacillosaminyl-diphospho-undecaprenol 4-alpha-N-acetylgalactosaminyltransferase [Latilactobacillus sakei]